MNRRLIALAFGLALALAVGCQGSPRPSGGTGSGAGGTAGVSGSGGVGGGGETGSGGGSGDATAMGSGAGNGGAGGNGGTTPAGSGGGGGAIVTDGGAAVDGSGDGAVPSEGCGASAPPQGGPFTIDVAGTPRQYILKVPAGYDARHPYPLILAFHGRMYSAQSVADGGPPGSGPYYGIESQAGGRAIFVAPQALDTSWTNQNGRDVAYVNAMLARFKGELCIDQSRLFATGFSMGAIMTIDLACSAGNVFRAIAPMSGSLGDACTGNQRIAYWGSHGTSDTTIPIAMGEMARDEFRRRDHCGSQSTVGTPAGCVNYQSCDAGFPVTWCTFSGAHEPAPFAGEAVWTFFAGF